MALAEFGALVGRIGGPGRVVLVGHGASGSRARLEAFARALFAPEEDEEDEERAKGAAAAAALPPCRPGAGSGSVFRREVRVLLGWGSSFSSSSCSSSSSSASASSCRAALPLPLPPLGAPPSSWPPGPGLVVVLLAAPSLLLPRERRLLREMLLDLRRRLRPRRRAPSALALALVAVAVALSPAVPSGAEAEDEARAQLEGLLRSTFGPGESLQAASYAPGAGRGGGGLRGVREAACRALRAALQTQEDAAAAAADEVETKKQKLPLFLQCLPWGRRRQQRNGYLGTAANRFDEGSPQDQDEGLALTNMAPNGNCEEACGEAGT